MTRHHGILLFRFEKHCGCTLISAFCQSHKPKVKEELGTKLCSALGVMIKTKKQNLIMEKLLEQDCWL
jgi:hypothetical protein